LPFPELIDSLEHIEVDQLHSDVPANVRAELCRMKRNVAAILRFVGNEEQSDLAADRQVATAIKAIRQECMSLHLTITKTLLFHFFRLHLVMDSKFSAVVASQYQRLGQSLCEMCAICAPNFEAQLGNAL
jgi:hypothetical protein